MKVTVIWNDSSCDNSLRGRSEVVEISDRKGIEIYVEGLVRQAMRQAGYDDDDIASSIEHYYLIGIIKGEVEWLA